ncbi:MAG: arginine--tRNA ligase [Planctomycetaceae bacterium]
MNLLTQIKQRFAPALAGLTSDVPASLEMIRPAQDSKFGDFQANFAMPLAKQLGRPPRDVATEVLAKLQIDDLCLAPEIAGPGFINLRLRTEVLAERLSEIAFDDRLGVSLTQQPRNVVVDFSSPNVAKPMHVGHLRSTVIGDSIVRTLRFAGHRVTSDNHIGDWGTQFGMIIYGYRHFRDEALWQASAVGELARLYKLVNQLSDYHSTKALLPAFEKNLSESQQKLLELQQLPLDDRGKKLVAGQKKALAAAESELQSAREKLSKVESYPALLTAAEAHPDIARKSREETAKLHAGDPENTALWQQFMPVCLAALQQIYSRLSISFDLTLGESHFNPMLAGVVESLQQQGLATVSEGAMCVFLEGNAAPFIVRKTDGAFTYATTDLATIQYRRDTLQAHEVLYVVDSRQSEHFQQLFATARLWGCGQVSLKHVSFGTVMGSDGRPYKTRAGDTVGLESLLDEAILRARRIVDENDDRREQPLLTADERARVAEIVGLGAVKYADLHHSRDSDYVFDYDKMLATTGDTATYMQYAYARVCGIFRRMQISRESLEGQRVAIELATAEERRLALQLLMFGYAVDSVLSDYRPHLLTQWLFETANAFSQFFDKCSVQNAETETLQRSRLVLCDLMARAIRTGLGLLGIEVAEVL